MIPKIKLKKWHKRGVLAFLLFFLFKLGYSIIQDLQSSGVSLNTTLDNAIPFMPIFVIFYILWYPVLLTPFILSLKRFKRFYQTSQSFLIVACMSFLIYALFQTQIRRAVIEGTDIFSRLVLWIYTNDMPVNCFPSLHVSGSVVSNLCTMKLNKRIGYFMMPITVLIILSTLFIKQHFVADVVVGIALAVFAYLVVFKIDWNKLKQELIANISKN